MSLNLEKIYNKLKTYVNIIGVYYINEILIHVKIREELAFIEIYSHVVELPPHTKNKFKLL